MVTIILNIQGRLEQSNVFMNKRKGTKYNYKVWIIM